MAEWGWATVVLSRSAPWSRTPADRGRWRPRPAGYAPDGPVLDLWPASTLGEAGNPCRLSRGCGDRRASSPAQTADRGEGGVSRSQRRQGRPVASDRLLPAPVPIHSGVVGRPQGGRGSCRSRREWRSWGDGMRALGAGGVVDDDEFPGLPGGTLIPSNTRAACHIHTASRAGVKHRPTQRSSLLFLAVVESAGCSPISAASKV